MKFFVNIVLLSFVLFLVSPSIVCCLEKDKKTYAFCEMDNDNSTINEVKLNFVFDSFVQVFDFPLLLLEPMNSLILSSNFSRYKAVWTSLFIPPPNNFFLRQISSFTKQECEGD